MPPYEDSVFKKYGVSMKFSKFNSGLLTLILGLSLATVTTFATKTSFAGDQDIKEIQELLAVGTIGVATALDLKRIVESEGKTLDDALNIYIERIELDLRIIEDRLSKLPQLPQPIDITIPGFGYVDPKKRRSYPNDFVHSDLLPTAQENDRSEDRSYPNDFVHGDLLPTAQGNDRNEELRKNCLQNGLGLFILKYVKLSEEQKKKVLETLNIVTHFFDTQENVQLKDLNFDRTNEHINLALEMVDKYIRQSTVGGYSWLEQSTPDTSGSIHSRLLSLQSELKKIDEKPEETEVEKK